VIVLLLWMYITGLIIIAGAEMNAEIEHASPWGKDPGEKVAGQRKKIGSAAERAYRALGQKPAPTPEPRRLLPAPSSQALPAPVFTTGRQGSFSDYATAFVLRLVWPRARKRVE